MRLERTKGSFKKGINDRPWNLLYVTPKEANSLIRSLTGQIVAGSSNVDRDETVLENGEWFTTFVIEDRRAEIALRAQKLDALSVARDAIMAKIIELEGGLEHAVEGKTTDSRVEGLKVAEMLIMRLQGEEVGWFEKSKKRAGRRRKKTKR